MNVLELLISYIIIFAVNVIADRVGLSAIRLLAYLLMLVNFLHLTRRREINIFNNISTSLKSSCFYSIIPHYFNLLILGLGGNAQVIGYINPSSKIILYLVSSIFEELYFRAYVFYSLNEFKWTSEISVKLSSVLFMLYHMPLKIDPTLMAFMLSYYVLGLILQRLYEKYNLLASIIFHLIFNFIGGFYSIAFNAFSSIVYSTNVCLTYLIMKIAETKQNT